MSRLSLHCWCNRRSLNNINTRFIWIILVWWCWLYWWNICCSWCIGCGRCICCRRWDLILGNLYWGWLCLRFEFISLGLYYCCYWFLLFYLCSFLLFDLYTCSRWARWNYIPIRCWTCGCWLSTCNSSSRVSICLCANWGIRIQFCICLFSLWMLWGECRDWCRSRSCS